MPVEPPCCSQGEEALCFIAFNLLPTTGFHCFSLSRWAIIMANDIAITCESSRERNSNDTRANEIAMEIGI